MKWFLKYRIELLLGLLIILIFFLIRLPHLTLQPIFADEAIYIRWAQVMRADPTLRFVSVTDGKTPLFMWMLIPFFKIFKDPLFAGRFLSVISGFFSLSGVFFLGWKVFGKRTSFWSALIYAVVPYTVFFDRMALVDSMLAAFTIWSLCLAIWLLKTPRLDLAMILGYLLGGAWLTKTPAFANLLALPLTIVGFDFKEREKTSLVKLLVFWMVAIVIALVMYNLLRLGPQFQQLSARNGDYVFSPTDLIGRPLDPLIPHLLDMTDWFPILITWPILILMFIGIVMVVLRRERLGWAVLLWAGVPMFLLIAFLKTFTARYLLLTIPPLLIFAGYSITVILSEAKNIKVEAALFRKIGLYPSFFIEELRMTLAIILLVVILTPTTYFDFLLLTNPQAAPLPKEERAGYLEEWTAGYGFPQIAQFLINQKQNGPVVVGTEGFSGTLPDGLEIYLDKANISIIGGTATISAQLRQSAQNNQTYFIGNKSRIGINISGVTKIMEFPKVKPLDGSVQDAIVVYRVNPSE